MHNISQSSTLSLQENHSKVKALSLRDVSGTSLAVLSWRVELAQFFPYM